MKVKKILLIDGMSVLFKHLLAGGLSNLSFGVNNTGGVFGFFRRLQFELQKSIYTHIYICFDYKCFWRKELYPIYKENRKKDDTIRKIIGYSVNTILDCFLVDNNQHKKINVIKAVGFEGDDMIAYLALEKFKDAVITIISDDFDLSQIVLLRKNCKLILSNKILKNQRIVRMLYPNGIGNAVADFKAMAGDSSDNVKGVLKLGKVTAGLIQKKYGSYKLFFTFNKNNSSNVDKKLKKYLTTECKREYDVCRKVVDLGYSISRYNKELKALANIKTDMLSDRLLKNIRHTYKKNNIKSLDPTSLFNLIVGK